MATKKQVATAAVGWHPIEGCQGLALLVKKGGARRFVLDYRHHGRQRRLTIGRPESMPVGEALKLARQRRVEIDGGRDPLAEKDVARRATEAAVTLSTFFAERYEEFAAEHKKKPRSIAEDKRLFAYTIRPRLGSVRVPDLSQDDVEHFLRGLSATPVVGNRCVALISALMHYAEKKQLRPNYSNPCRHVTKYREEKRHRFLSGEQLVALGTALRESEESPEMIAAIRLLLFTGCRRGETLGLRWDAVRFDAGVLDLADSKTGRKLVTLNAPARAVLDAVPRAGEYVFPARSPTWLGAVWRRIRARAGLPGVRIHDLRHCYGSTAAGLGTSLPIVAALLGHKGVQHTQRYAGLADTPVSAAAERVGERLASLLSPPEQPAPVVPMKRRRGRG